LKIQKFHCNPGLIAEKKNKNLAKMMMNDSEEEEEQTALVCDNGK